MKRLLLCCICYLPGLINSYAQKPEPVYSIARIGKPVSWYREQAIAWQKVLNENPKDANAWYNYYYAHRTLRFHDTTDKRSIKEKDADITKLIDNMGREIPGTYEYNLCKWMAGGFDLSLLPYLEKAAELGKGRTEHLDFMINIGEISRDINKRDRYCLEKFAAGLISPGMMYYNYNTITGLAPNAILITSGDNDTYPAWVLQAQNTRKDVRVLNLSLLQINEYRSKIFKELDIDSWNMYHDPDEKIAEADRNRFKKGIIKHIAANKKNYPVYVALSASGAREAYIKPIEENLYLTGLAYLYSKNPIDNIAVMKRNFEQQYNLDYLDHAFYEDISSDLVKLINQNYIVPMLKLYDHYKISGDTPREEWIRNKLLAISKGTEDEEDVKKHITRL